MLLLPTSAQVQTSGGGLPKFSGTDWPLNACVLPGLDALLGPIPGATAGTERLAFTAGAPGGADALFNALRNYFNVGPPDPTPNRLARLNSVRIKKELPPSYTSAFSFERPRAGTTTDNEFGCSLRDNVPALPGDPKPPQGLTWGAVLSYALRQPLLARALGLIYDLTIPLASPSLLHAGGWLYFELGVGAPVPTVIGAVRSYAARLPPLAANATRVLFGAVLLPVGSTAAGDYGEALSEAAVYDDGFAKIVHASQAVSADATSTGHNELRPATDAGMDLGWDDEQVTEWLNRQVDALRARLDPTTKAIEAALGIGGYRIDVRSPEDPAGGGWASLCEAFSVDVDGNPAELRFPPAPAGVAFAQSFDGELTVEPVPAQSRHSSDGVAWLPRHFTRWQGGSLVVNDQTHFRLTGENPVDALGKPIKVLAPTYGAATPGIRLRYGQLYEFRCRMADLTGGGPSVDDGPENAAPHPTATARFLRHIPAKSVRIETDGPPQQPGKPTPPVPTLTKIDVWRPLIGYPEMVFAGIDDPAVIAQLIADAPAARANGQAVGANDPDVTQLLVSVQVRAPAHDPGPVGRRDGEFRELYTTTLDFPEFDPDAVLTAGAPLTLQLEYRDIADVAKMIAPAAGVTTLPLPRARDVRLRLTPICQDRPEYFGAAWVRKGLTSDIATRAVAETEPALFAAQEDERALNALLFQPGANLIQRLAARVGLTANGLTLGGRPGERVVFGASGALRNALAADGSSITFATEAELLGHWVCVFNELLTRDWSWDGLRDEGIAFHRRDKPADPPQQIGRIQLPFAVGPLAVADDADERSQTRIVFFDAIDPKPPLGSFPEVITPEWQITPRFRGLADNVGDAVAKTLAVRLPVAVAPRQNSETRFCRHRALRLFT